MSREELITSYLSKDRLEPYLTSAEYDFAEALLLYQKNKKLSSQFHSLLAELEVLLRNSINNLLAEEIGENWLEQNLINLDETQYNIIKSVIKTLRKENKQITNSNLISNLNFGFWVYLFNTKYDKTLWRKYLHKIFTNKPKNFKRSKVRLELEKFKNLRNRIAHCEYILKYPCEQYMQDIIEFINYINPEITNWIEEITK